MGTSGGNQDQGLDIGRHVTGTCEGSGTSATRTRRTVPRAGASHGGARPRTRLSPATCKRGGGRGWGHQGTLRAKPGGQPPGAARAAEGPAVSPSADPTYPHPQSPGVERAERLGASCWGRIRMSERLSFKKRNGANPAWLALPLVVFALITLTVGLVARQTVREPYATPFFHLFFTDTLEMKAWLATAAVVLACGQLLTAARIYKLLRFPPQGRFYHRVHRWKAEQLVDAC